MSKSQIIIGILLLLAIGVVAVFKLNSQPSAPAAASVSSGSIQFKMP